MHVAMVELMIYRHRNLPILDHIMSAIIIIMLVKFEKIIQLKFAMELELEFELEIGIPFMTAMA